MSDPVTALATAAKVSGLARTAHTLVSDFLVRRDRARIETMWDAYIDAVAVESRLPREEAEAAAVARLSAGRKEHDDLLYEMFRLMTFSPCDESRRLIARLTAPYVQEGRPADTFFRRCGWLLERCDPDDMALLNSLMDKTRESIEGIDLEKHWAIVWSLEVEPPKPTRISAHPFERGSHPDRTVGGAVEGTREREAQDFYAVLIDSRLVPSRKNERLMFRKEDGNLVRLVELFTGPLSREVRERLRAPQAW